MKVLNKIKLKKYNKSFKKSWNNSNYDQEGFWCSSWMDSGDMPWGLRENEDYPFSSCWRNSYYWSHRKI